MKPLYRRRVWIFRRRLFAGDKDAGGAGKREARPDYAQRSCEETARGGLEGVRKREARLDQAQRSHDGDAPARRRLEGV
eukprot:962044-Prorocentrum_minimum.AAC.2